MEIIISPTKKALGQAAAIKAAGILQKAVKTKGKATFVAATGASQFEFLDELTRKKSIDWSRTTMFHLDEYIGIPETHPASFRRYLRERIIDKVHPAEVHLINGDVKNPKQECKRLNEIISRYTIDVAFVGIGENGHLAFNDPPADFKIGEPFIVVKLDEECRKQQLGEGWFKNLEDVPYKAITMSVSQIIKSEHIICVVPDKRKAEAVRNCLEKKILPQYPASILRRHKNVYLFLDKDSSMLLRISGKGRGQE
ncbi:MAG: glucosamine-6-phosphate deaminase [Candidatus Omnitrophica bacterium]|nr:glucosamine-6-phosphate deaminase [Candidatus Omnitrophota bacterium]